MKALPPIAETVHEEEPEEDLDQTPTQQNESWLPRPTYNVSASRTYKSRTDLDSQADTTVLGKHCVVVFDTNRTADVSPFLPELGTAEKVRIIKGAVAYDHPDGETIILIVNQALYIPALQDNLLCDNQCRMNDVVVNSCPKSLLENPNDNTHTLHFSNHDNFVIPMALRGTISHFLTQSPTPREYNECRHLELTAETPDSNPHSRLFDENENAMTNEDGYMKHPSRWRTIMKARTDSNLLLDALEFSESMSPVP